MIKATRNQIGNASNPYQGSFKRVLCVCSAGLLRSPTTANVLHKTFGYNTRAAGSNEQFALIPVSEALLHWAEEIVFVNHENLAEALHNNQELATVIQDKAVVLDIPDNFEYNHPTLSTIIVNQYIDKTGREAKND